MRGEASQRRRFLVPAQSVRLPLPSSPARMRFVEHRVIDLALEGQNHSSEADVQLVGRDRRLVCGGPRGVRGQGRFDSRWLAEWLAICEMVHNRFGFINEFGGAARN